MIIASTARTHGMLGIDKWSLATTRYPYGDIAYGDGSLFIDYLARTRGAPSIGQFVERVERRHDSVPPESHGASRDSASRSATRGASGRIASRRARHRSASRWPAGTT